MKNTKFFYPFFTLLFTFYSNAQEIKKITGFSHIESVASDGRFIYVADIGVALNPTAKDGDGKIIKLDNKGNIIDAAFAKETLNAPKGLATDGGILYVNDIDRLCAIDLQSGNTLYTIDFSKDTSFLNDIAVWDENTLYVSATDKNKLFKVDLQKKNYSEVIIDSTISGINGLAAHKKSNKLYINGFGSDNKPNGIAGYINVKQNKFTKLTTFEGYYDGIAIQNDMLYLSNWIGFEKKGVVLSIRLYDNKLSRVAIPELIGGPADFIIFKNQLVIPAMIEGILYFVPL